MESKKKVLLISYYWPPAGGIALLRALKTAKYLRDYGWEPIIFTAKDAHYPSLDPTSERDIPADLTVLKQKIWEPYHIYKFITGKKKDANVNNVFYVQEDAQKWTHRLSVWIRSNFFIPDARSLWVRPAVKFLTQYLEENPVDAIWSTGPPHTNNRIATLLRKRFDLPWIADFQDPWTQVDYYQMLSLTKWGAAKHERMEQEVFQHADICTIVSDTWKQDLQEIGAKRVEVLPLGFDRDDFKNLNQQVKNEFTFTHLGMMGYDRNPQVLFEVLRDLKDVILDFDKHLKIRLIGMVDPRVNAAIEANNLTENVEFIGSIPRDQALQKMLNSPILLLLLNQQDNAKGRIPGKLFEYLYSRRPIFTLGPTDSDVAKILTETGGGMKCDYADYDGIKQEVLRLYQLFLEQQISAAIDSKIDKYDVQLVTQEIAKILNEIAEE
ncbi:MAG: glycosyltransferase [Saprospiraceae bacterium]